MTKFIPSRKFEHCLDLLGVQSNEGWAHQDWRRQWGSKRRSIKFELRCRNLLFSSQGGNFLDWFEDTVLKIHASVVISTHKWSMYERHSSVFISTHKWSMHERHVSAVIAGTRSLKMHEELMLMYEKKFSHSKLPCSHPKLYLSHAKKN